MSELVPLLGLIIIILGVPPMFVFIFVLGQQYEKASQKKNLYRQPLVNWLKQQQSAGITTISKLLADLQLTTIHKHISPKIAEKPAKAHVIDKTSQQNTNAMLLLYVGAVLIVFSVFIFTAFNWENFSNLTKSILLVGFTASFYMAGLIIMRFKTLKQAGATFITIASISLGFTGIGLWKFTLGNILNIDFSLYWLAYSMCTTLVYALILYFMNLRKYSYLLIISIYSTILSFAFTLTDLTEYRIIVIAALNLLFYISDKTTTKLTKEINWSTRFANQLLNALGIIIVISSLISGVTHPTIIYLPALFIPTAFQFVSWFKEKHKIETTISIIVTPIKVLLTYFVFVTNNSNPANLTVILVAYCVLSTIIAELIFHKEHKTLHTLLTTVTWLIVGLTTLFYTALTSNLTSAEFTITSNLFILLVNTCVLIIPQFVKKRSTLLAISLNYIIFTCIQLLYTFVDNPEPHHITTVFITLEILVFSLHLLINKNLSKKSILAVFKFSLLPLAIFSGLFSLAIITNKANITTIIAFSTFSIILTVIAQLHKVKFINFLTIPLNFIAYISAIGLIDTETSINIETHHTGLLLFIPAFAYAAQYEIAKLKGKYTLPRITGGLLFWLFGLILSTTTDTALIIALSISLIYWVYALFKFQKQYIPYIIYLFANLLTYHTLNMGEAQSDTILLHIALLAISFTSISYIKHNTLTPKLTDKVRKHLSFGTLILTFFIFPIVFLFIRLEPSHTLALTALAFSANLAIASKRQHILMDIAGVGVILAIWNYVFQLDAGSLRTQLTLLPVTVGLLLLAYKYFIVKKKSVSLNLESSAYILHSLLLLIQSISLTKEENVLFGVILICVSIIILLWGMRRSIKPFITISIFFLIIELIIRLYVVLINTPWYIYTWFFGFSLLLLAIYMLWQVGKKKK